ncbi:MAG: hypothetical protein JRJ66_01555 [Deltaproteobacteria bacterium]|nr:hypothetical protein [Deltaproteobacteria bacterium]MBW2081669.1 hypothetical protein [Deltaproteobacteria bacterium]MBW2298863.1 hypothetical protein [Deltaproteobacteria bacterium]
MKLSDAKWCPNCDEVYEHDMCPACGDTHGAWIEMWIAPPESKKVYFGHIKKILKREDARIYGEDL